MRFIKLMALIGTSYYVGLLGIALSLEFLLRDELIDEDEFSLELELEGGDSLEID